MNKSLQLKISQGQKNRLKDFLEKNPELIDFFSISEENQSIENDIGWLNGVLNKKQDSVAFIEKSRTQNFEVAKKFIKDFFDQCDENLFFLVAISSYATRIDDAGRHISFPSLPLMKMRLLNVKSLFSILAIKDIDFFACSSLDQEKIAFVESYVGDTERSNPDMPVYEFFAVGSRR
jgi:hypothetical protein